MRSWIELYDTFLPGLTGCSMKLACDKLRTAARHFCERSGAWRMALDPLRTVANVAIYEFDLDPDQQLVRLLWAKLDGHDLPLRTHARPGERCLVVLSPTQFEIHPTPLAKGQRIDLFAALMPSATASGLDDGIAGRYLDGIVLGARAELFKLTDQPFANPAAAAQDGAGFDEAIARATSDVGRAYSSAPVRTVPSFY